MLTGTNTTIKKGGDFEAVPTDKYTVLIADVNPVQRPKFHSTELEEKLNFQFTILDDREIPAKPGAQPTNTRGRFLWHAMSKSLGGRSWLLKLVRAVYGRELLPEDFAKFETDGENMVNALVGHQVDIMVEQAPNADRTAIYNNIVSYFKSNKELSVPEDAVAKKDQQVRESVTTPAVAPVETADPEKFIGDLKKEAEDTTGKVEQTPEEAEAEALELQAKAATARAKAAKAKADAAKKE